MKTIKIYDVNALLLQEANLEAFYYEKVAVFVTEKGVVVAESEAVHQCKNVITDSIVIDANTPTEEGHIAILPDKRCFVVIKDIIEKAPYEKMAIEQFFEKRDYNSRCRGNWATLMESLRGIEYNMNENITYKQYQCTLCGQIRWIQTNHTSDIPAYCVGCSWKAFYRGEEESISTCEHRHCRMHKCLDVLDGKEPKELNI